MAYSRLSQFEDNILKNCGAILHYATYTLNQGPICDAVFSIARINIGIKRWRWECFFSILYLKICLQNFCFSYHNIKLTDLKILKIQGRNHNSSFSTELENETASWTFSVPHTTEPTDK